MNNSEKSQTLRWLREMHKKFGQDIAVERKNGARLRFGDIIDDIIETVKGIPAAEDCHECKDCSYFEPVWGDELLGRCTQAKAWYENRCIWDYCSNGRTTETAEPQPDGIQFRTVDDLGRICIPKDIRDKLGVKPGTECAVYSTDELTSDEIIVIRRNENDKTP